MNTMAAQSSSLSETSKRKFREIDHKARRKLTLARLEKKGHSTRTRAQIEENIKTLLEEDVLTCDLLLCLWATSLFCYRKASICNPFPEDFTSNENKDFESAEMYTTALPSMQHLKNNPAQLSNLPLPALKLLSFIVDPAYHDEIQIRQISLAQYKKETSNIDSMQSQHSDPNFIFKLEYTDQHPLYPKFQNLQKEFGSTMGFHGSSFENFHSIVRSGLDATFGRDTSLFGEGTYLSSDRDVAFSFLKSGPNGSKQSSMGSHLGCLVCAEVACNPKSVRISNRQDPQANTSNALPNGYIVAQDNDCVLVRYILVYQDFKAHTKKKVNVCYYIAIFYVLLLIGIWLLRSSTAKHFYATHFTH